MHVSRQKILQILKENGATTVDELSDALSLTTVTIRHHLDILRSEGLVGDPVVRRRSTPGRPQYAYALTEQASRLFPTNYANLAIQLINEVKAHASDQEIKVIFAAVGDRLVSEAPRPEPSASLETRLSRAVGYLNAHGYMARWENTPDGCVIYTCNCPYREISDAHQELCSMDLALIASLVGCAPERICRAGDRRDSCVFLVCDALPALAA